MWNAIGRVRNAIGRLWNVLGAASTFFPDPATVEKQPNSPQSGRVLFQPVPCFSHISPFSADGHYYGVEVPTTYWFSLMTEDMSRNGLAYAMI
ncbi:hypothetical protein L0Z16_23105 [Burkholderia multivorans]|uniref:hypothetical protein n=1 Tax=Burkholderia multivorans TaxID=87883 RepID=UPI0020196A36|nr:hypothetical protein [Burkholderia multivorans]MCO1353525.1 hypothetical protein [Burkholderia multivorans]UQP44606.1 hypothetical protein L0Z16_23105 [Burkholderia multivorans]